MSANCGKTEKQSQNEFISQKFYGIESADQEMGNIFGSRRTRSQSASDQLASNGNIGGKNDGKKSPSENSVFSTKKLVSPFIYQRKSSLYIDEDGDFANEFYKEVIDQSLGRPNLAKINESSLTRQGMVDYDIPRLHPSFPYIMVEVGVPPR